MPARRLRYLAGAGRAERVREAAFAGEMLGPGHPCQDVAVLLVSELSESSVQRSRSADPGEAVRSLSGPGDGMVRVEVIDGGGPRASELRWVGRDAEGGPGLQFVAALAAR
jgi:hypothetical protein